MSKVIVELDTTAKTASVSIDGVDVPNFCSVSVYYDPESNYYPLSLSINSCEKQGDLRVTKTLYASKADVSKMKTKVEGDVKAFFKRGE